MMLASAKLTSAETADHVASILGAKAGAVDPTRFDSASNPFHDLEHNVRAICECELEAGKPADAVEIVIVDGHLGVLLEALEYAALEEPPELTDAELATAKELAAHLGVMVA